MATIVLTEQRDGHDLILQRSRRCQRLLSRLATRRLDETLAAGASPDSSPALSMHAYTLIGAVNRRKLARDLRGVLHEAEQSYHPHNSRLPICRCKVLEARAAVEALVERLEALGPVDAQGVAQLRLLLTDGYGPLFNHPTVDDLLSRLHAALDALEPSCS